MNDAAVDRLRFDDRVAIVTGAGGNPGLGRAYALFLAARGARVVVNDLGVGPDGRSVVPTDAGAVVEEIVAAGGEAIADRHSVADEADARAIVQTALDAWGRLDIVINNAGVCYVSTFEEISPVDIRRTIDVHLLGSLWMCRAAWPAMSSAGYGRIVNTVSSAMFGVPDLVVYGAAKAGIFGLTKGLALEGARVGIHVNAVSPAAATAAGTHNYDFPPDALDAFQTHFPPEAVAAVVGYLAHERCTVSGTVLQAGAGEVTATLFGDTAGHRSADLTIEEVAAHLETIFDADDLQIVNDPTNVRAANRDAENVLRSRPYQPG